MTSTGGQEYDANLLASAPAATKAQLQDGYNPDILVEKPTPPPSRHDIEAAIPASAARNEGAVAYPSQKQPFYRTKKGIIVIFVVLVVIIAAAVGGGVGGSKKKNKTDSTAPANSQDAAPAPASGSGSSTASASAATTSNGQVVGPPISKSSTGPGVPVTPNAPTPTTQTTNSNAEAAAQLVGMIVDGR